MCGSYPDFNMTLLWLRTSRLSAVILAFLEHYPGSEIRLENTPVNEPQGKWCTNRRLKATLDFSLKHDGIELLAFHDGPDNMWVHESTRLFVEQLASQRLLRFSMEHRESKRDLIGRILARVFGI